MDMNTGVINFEVYENGSNYLGLAKVTLPTISYKTSTVNGAGIAGDIEIPNGMIDAMNATFEFTDSNIGAIKLSRPGEHLLDMRVAHNHYDSNKGAVKVEAHKYVMKVVSKSRSGGDAAPASNHTRTVETSVLWYKEFINGKLVAYVDPINFRNVDETGKDSLAEVRKALGK